VTGASAVNPLVAFYDIHRRKREVLYEPAVRIFSLQLKRKVVWCNSRKCVTRLSSIATVHCASWSGTCCGDRSRPSRIVRRLTPLCNATNLHNSAISNYFCDICGVLRASEGTLSRWSRLLLQSLAPTNPHWARVVAYCPFSLCVIRKQVLCPSSGDINRLLMKMCGVGDEIKE
jgi:hypothetical protein